MSIITSPLLLGADGVTQYQVSRSLRFNSTDSAYLNRTPSVASNSGTWTWAGWVKKTTSDTGFDHQLIGARASGVSSTFLRFTSDKLRLNNDLAGAQITTLQLFRDYSSWYHIVAVYDANNATQSDRIRLYVNGIRADVTGSYPTSTGSTSYINTVREHSIGRDPFPEAYFNGYLADVHFIDGQALTPSSFTETDATTGQLIPKAYTGGSYGTNGFKLNFSDNSTAAALGTDTSGNGNTWTVNNLSVTAGSGNDSLVDTPTSYGTDTGVGNEVRGNYATFNPLASAGTFSNGNLQLATSGGDQAAGINTIGLPASGKWYWEVTMDTIGTDAYTGITNGTDPVNVGSARVAYRQNGEFVSTPGATDPPTAASYTTGDIIGLAFNADNLSLAFYKNGSLQGTTTGIASRQYFTLCYCNTTAQRTINFGQRAFAYTAPSGFKALCDTNLPTPVIAKPNTVMDVVLYTGTGAALTPTSSLGFNPDWIWIKSRSAATDHALYDVVRGAQARLESNTTDAEVTTDGGVTAFNSAGFTLGTLAQVNTSSATYAAWCWDAGTSTVTNTAGSISSQVRANASAGFSIVTATTPASGTFTIGHGLGVAPSFVITKTRAITDGWYSYHKSLGPGSYISLNRTDASLTNNQAWQNTDPSSTVVYGTAGQLWNTSASYVIYCFAPVSGYSAMGSWTGNGSSDGPFVFTGHRSRFLLYKRSDVANDWYIMDTARDTYNVSGTRLFPNLSNAEFTYTSTDLIDVTANGFKIRSSNAAINANGGTYIYMALAENPFQYARAR